jgi:hypothetical protein
MGWFDHKHYWLPKTALNTIKDPQSGGIIGALIVEGCSCGAVRTIEYQPGADPIVRLAASIKAEEPAAHGTNDLQAAEVKP